MEKTINLFRYISTQVILIEKVYKQRRVTICDKMAFKDMFPFVPVCFICVFFLTLKKGSKCFFISM